MEAMTKNSPAEDVPPVSTQGGRSGMREPLTLTNCLVSDS